MADLLRVFCLCAIFSAAAQAAAAGPLTVAPGAAFPLGTAQIERGSYGWEMRIANGGRYAGYGSGGALYGIVDLQSGRVVPVDTNSVAWTFGPDGKSAYVATAAARRYYFIGGELRTLDERDIRQTFGPGAVMPAYLGLAASPDGKRLAAAFKQRQTEDYVKIDPADMFVLLDPAKNPDAVAIVGKLAEGFAPQRVVFSPDGKRLAAEQDGKLRLWDFGSSSGKPAELSHSAKAGGYGMSFTADGKSLVTFDGAEATRWDLAEQRSRRIDLKAGHPGKAWGAAVSPAGPIYATCGDGGEVLLKNLDGDSVLSTVSAGRGPVVAAAFSRDGATLVTLGSDGGKDVLKVWKVSTP